MRGTRELRHIGTAIIIVLAAIALSASYWAVAGPDTILQRHDNPRQIEAIAGIQRGSIYDIDGQLLVDSSESETLFVRRYHRPATFSLVGYHSLRYGAGLAEAAFHNLLNGSDEIRTLDDFVSRKLLRIPQIGTDIQLTVSAEIQDRLVTAMGKNPGAAVVMDARTGAILALVSQPGFDPNTLDDDWDELTSAPGEPFFHRALQGQYQPGNAMMTLWLAQAIQHGFDLDRDIDNADTPVVLVEDMRVSCVLEPPRTTLSLRESYHYGCPAPFLELSAELPGESLESIASSFALAKPIVLADFPSPELFPLAVESNLDDRATDLHLKSEALGQGQLTITPLHLAAIMSAIASDGRTPPPYVLAAIREPGSQRWTNAAPEINRREMIGAQTAHSLRLALQNAWKTISDGAPSIGESVGAQIAKSQSGEGQQIWLYGFVTAENDAIAFVVLQENSDDATGLISTGIDLVDALASRIPLRDS